MTRRAQLGWTVALLAIACGPTTTKTPGTDAPGDDDGPGLVSIATPHGATLAPPTKVVIPPSGGTLSSNDGSIRISVPAGAVAAPTEFTITPIANTARGAVGPAFRLGPDGATFRAPVVLTFKAPAQYPTGTSITGVGVEYQDHRGFWHRVEPAVRNAAAGTVSVTTDHFSDWALTWQTSEAAAEGPIKLEQSVGIPFTAQGRATLFLQGDNASETVYLLTGTLTVPSTIKVDGVDCTPDQITKTLPLNVAEIVKGSPPVFRWGMGVTWTLSCPGPDNTVTTHLLPALFDTMYINLTRCGGYYEAGQIVEAGHLKGQYTKNCGVEGSVSATWDLRTCIPDAACLVGTECRLGVTACTNGVATCVESGIAPNGTTCGPQNNFVCSESICVDPKDANTGITISPTAPLVTAEPDGVATFTVALATQPTTNVTVGLASSNTAEGTVSPESLEFTPQNWNAPQEVTVTGKDDPVVDGPQGYTIVLAPAVSGDPRYSGFRGPSVAVTNDDDDIPGFIVTPDAGLVTSEAGTAASFTIVMKSQPVADVTVPMVVENPLEGALSDGAVVFSPANWNVARTVTVTGVEDFVADGPKSYMIAIGPTTSSDPVYHERDVVDVAVTNSDNDSAGITVSPTNDLLTHENGDSQVFTVVLNSEPTGVVTIPIRSGNPGEGSVSSGELTFTPANWYIAQLVTVAGVEDFVDDDNQPYIVTIGPATSTDVSYEGALGADVAVVNVDDDTTGVELSRVSGLLTTEGGFADSFTMKLTSQPLADVTIALSSSRPEEGTVSPASVTFTPSDWSTAQTVTVAGVDEFVVDGHQDYAVVTAAATSADTKYNGFDAPDVAVTNNDDDTVGIIVTPITALQTTEAAGAASFTVVLRSQPLADVTVPFTTSDTTEGTVAPASVTFSAATWNQPQTVTLTGVDDAIADGPQTYFAIIHPAESTDLAYAAIDVADLSLTNTDNDAAGVSVTPSSGLVTNEDGGTATFTLALQSEPTADVTITLESSSPGEGTPSPASVTFTAANWSTAQTITITGANDPIADGSRAYTITTTASSADPQYATIEIADVSVTNLDNDVAGVVVSEISGPTTESGGTATFTISLSSQPTAAVAVSLMSSDTSEGTVALVEVVFTPLDWSMKTVTVTGVNDAIDDGDVTYTILTGTSTSADPNYANLGVADVVVSNVDDDASGIVVSAASGFTTEGGVSASFTVSLSSQPTANVTVTFSGDTSEGAISPSSVVFTPLDWSQKIVTVEGVDDAIDDGDVVYAVRGVASSPDPVYNGAPVGDVLFTNLDNDAVGIAVSPTFGLQTTEAGGQATFTVVLLSQPSADVVVGLVSDAPDEGIASPAALTFTTSNWSTPRTVTITGQDDSIDDGPVLFTIVTTASSADAAYAAIDPDNVLVTNDDNDAAGIAVSPTSGLTVSETGELAQFTVVLASQPTSDVTVLVASDATDEGTVSTDSLTFTAANWSTPQAVTVTGVDDFVVDGSVAFSVVTTVSTADPSYAVIDPANVLVTNTDNDSASIVVTPLSPLVTTEGGGQALFSLALTSAPTAAVTISLSSNDTGEGTVAPTSVTFDSGNWSTPQDVTVTGVDDTEVDGDQLYAVTFGVSSADSLYGAMALADLTLSNTDDGEPVAGSP